jgi:hypothetical protein
MELPLQLQEWEMFKLKPKKKEEPAPVYKFVPLKPNPALAMAPLNSSAPAQKVPISDFFAFQKCARFTVETYYE